MTDIPVVVTAHNAAGTTSANASITVGSGTTTPVNVGETTILPITDNGNGNLLIAQPINLTTQSTIQTLSFYVATVGGQLRLGLYSGNTPTTLVAQTAAFTPVAGWNTQSVLTQVSVAAGKYWLAYFPQSNTLAFRKADTGGPSYYKSVAFGAMPATFPAAPNTTSSHWSLYGTFSQAPPVVLAPVVNNANFTIPMVNAVGDSVGTVTAKNNPTSWAISDQNFSISNTGLTRVAKAPLVAPSYSMTATATNSAGSGMGTILVTRSSSAATLPTGVTLQAIDGETMLTSTTMSNNYYSRNGYTYAANASTTIGTGIWSAGMSWDDTRFYPIGCFFGLYTDVLTQFLDLGLNFSIAVAVVGSGSTVLANGVWVAVSGDAVYNAVAMGTHIDEPSTLTGLQSTISTTANADQDGRVWQIAGTHNNLNGGDISGTSMATILGANFFVTPNASHTSIGMFSADLYWFSGSTSSAWLSAQHGNTFLGTGGGATQDQAARGSHYGNMIDVYRSWGNGGNTGGFTTASNGSGATSRIPFLSLPENTDGLLGDAGHRTIKSQEINWAVWSSIIHGARGIDYFTVAFNHNGGFDNTLQSGETVTRYDQAKATNLLVRQLAPVLNSPFALAYATVSPAGYLFPTYQSNWLNGGIELCVKWYQGGNVTNAGLALVNGFYIIAGTRVGEATTNTSATFTVASGTLATVVGESRTIAISGGTFTDTFANAWTIHIYQIS